LVLRRSLRSDAALALLLTFACDGEQQQAARAEAGRIRHAVAALREAPNDAKPPRIAALDREQCSVPELCELKRSCVEAYRVFASGMEGSRVAGRALDADAGAEAAQRIAELVRVSERDLGRARELTRRCSELEAEVARRHGL
jgi:hypothetical protein